MQSFIQSHRKQFHQAQLLSHCITFGRDSSIILSINKQSFLVHYDGLLSKQASSLKRDTDLDVK